MSLAERLAKKREEFSASKTGDGYTWSYVHEADWWLNAIAGELSVAAQEILADEHVPSGVAGRVYDHHMASARWLRREASE